MSEVHPAISQIEALQAIFGGGPLAAFIAILLIANVAQFWLLIQAKNDHLKTALMLVPVATKLEASVAKNAEVLQAAIQVLREVPRRRRAADLYSEAPTIVGPPPKKEDGDG